MIIVMDELLEQYKIDRINIQPIQWSVYTSLNEDLKHLKTNQRAIEHWIKHGIREKRSYSDTSKEILEYWSDIYKYQVTNNYKHTSFAFIVTTCVRQTEHLVYLIKCLESIRSVYPDGFIYVINDNSNERYNIEDSLKQFENIEVVESIAKGGGEINPYLFILDPRCNHDKLIFIHDSAFLKDSLDVYIHSEEEILFFWYSISSKFNDTTNKTENSDIFKNFYLYNGNMKICLENYFHIIKGCKYFDVKFGSMSIFTKAFMKKVDAVTNFVECSKLFKNRINRCLLERLLTILYIFVYNKEFPTTHYICGDINRHPLPFVNRDTNALYKPIVKVWQGR
jgi:hypothetical protein